MKTALEDMASQARHDGRSDALLRSGADPDPVEIVNGDAVSPMLIVCEHAGRAIPQALGDLGLPAGSMDRHIAYDVGAERVARELARRFACPLILQRYSRLVIDCNRPPTTAQSIPQTSDSTRVPANVNLSKEDCARRVVEIFEPFAEACQARSAAPSVRFLFSVHSFTPVMDRKARAWDIGFLYRAKCSLGDQLATMAEELWPELCVGRNQPYQIENETDWFIPICAEPAGRPHALIEIRNDHLGHDSGCIQWADRLHRLFSDFMQSSPRT